MEFNSIALPLIDQGSDLLYILNCCFGTNAAFDDHAALLAASSFHEIAQGPATYNSFPKAIVTILNKLGPVDITVAELFSTLMRAIPKLASTPLYVPKSDHDGAPIHLPFYNSTPGGLPPEIARLHSMMGIRSIKPETYVHLRIRFDSNLPSLDDFYKWLSTRTSDDTSSIDITGVFGSQSLYIKVPIIVWASFRQYPAYTFVGLGLFQ